LANSRDVQGWLIDSSRDEDFRPLLLVQVDRLDELLRKSAVPTEAVPVADGLAQLPDVLQKLLKSADPDLRELVHVIQLLVWLNEVSCRFADKLLKQNEALLSDRRQLHRELTEREGAGEEHEKQFGGATRAKNDALGAQQGADAEAGRPAEGVAGALRLSDGSMGGLSEPTKWSAQSPGSPTSAPGTAARRRPESRAIHRRRQAQGRTGAL
jgi:hypothetical protein